jgi:hypothetical protein
MNLAEIFFLGLLAWSAVWEKVGFVHGSGWARIHSCR